MSGRQAKKIAKQILAGRADKYNDHQAQAAYARLPTATDGDLAYGNDMLWMYLEFRDKTCLERSRRSRRAKAALKYPKKKAA